MLATYKKRRTALSFILHALIPYTQENVMLVFRKNQFLFELEKASGYKQQTLNRAWTKAKQQGLIVEKDKVLKITQEGLRKIQPLIAKKLAKDVQLMIIFDIPEHQAYLRRRLRSVLREWHFVQVQKSVMVSQFDYKDSLAQLIDELELTGFVQLFETYRLFPK